VSIPRWHHLQGRRRTGNSPLDTSRPGAHSTPAAPTRRTVGFPPQSVVENILRHRHIKLSCRWTEVPLKFFTSSGSYGTHRFITLPGFFVLFPLTVAQAPSCC